MFEQFEDLRGSLKVRLSQKNGGRAKKTKRLIRGKKKMGLCQAQ